ncbi:MAG: DUF4097 family beta strand repeat-containing protein [Clostridia bacterium]|nr:DUF4097 family beta strand repeat-containing protein [Clostridia bacterium]
MRRAFVYIFLAALALAAASMLTGCTDFRTSSYANADRYTAGDAEFTEKIEKIEIDWAGGSVNLVLHSGDTVLLTEAAEEGMPEELRVHWWLEGSTLHVQYAASGAKQRAFNSWRKELTLTVPEALSLDDIEIRTASATVAAEGLTAETLDISTASGSIRLDCAADAIRLNSASGSVQLTQRDSAAEVCIETASGRIDAALGHVDAAELESASGRIALTAASLDSLSTKTTSGAIRCELEAAPSTCRLRSTSSDVALSLPEDADFTAKVSTTSGDFESDFALKKDGRNYICGSGSAGIEIDTTSGDVSIQKN